MWRTVPIYCYFGVIPHRDNHFNRLAAMYNKHIRRQESSERSGVIYDAEDISFLGKSTRALCTLSVPVAMSRIELDGKSHRRPLALLRITFSLSVYGIGVVSRVLSAGGLTCAQGAYLG